MYSDKSEFILLDNKILECVAQNMLNMFWIMNYYFPLCCSFHMLTRVENL